MMRVLQTKFGEAEGNCFPACVASVLELPLETIPNFIEQEKETGNHWFWLCNQWLEQLNLALVHLEIPDAKTLYNAKKWALGYHLAGVTSPRNLKHSVVIKNGKVVHDPHPDQDSLNAKIKDIQLFIVRNASALQLFDN